MAKKIPASKPFWPFTLGAIGIGFSWTYLPHAFTHAFNEVPIAKHILGSLPAAHILEWSLPYVAPTIVSFASLMLICKGLQILDPEEFDVYNNED